MRLSGGAVNLRNGSFRRQKALQPTVEPPFRLLPIGPLAGKEWLIERLKTLLKTPTHRTYCCVRSDGFFRVLACLPICNRAQRFDLRAHVSGAPTPRQRHKLLQKVVFVPAGHFNWGIPLLLIDRFFVPL